MRLEIVKSFLSQNECTALNSWVEEAIQKKWMDNGFSQDGLKNPHRFTSRMYGNRFVYPQWILDISKRIRDFCGVADSSVILHHGRDGIVVSCTLPGGDIYPHADPQSDPYLAVLRCNVLTRKADAGGILHLENQPVQLEVGDLHCYLASNHTHYVSRVEGNTSRVLWMFGALVNTDDWDCKKIVFSKNKR